MPCERRGLECGGRHLRRHADRQSRRAPTPGRGQRFVEETAGGGRTMNFVKGPLFAHVLLADEIHRATRTTQPPQL